MPERLTADIDDDFVVFLIGMHVNRWRSVRSWGPVFRAMPAMLAELRAKPELGLLKAYQGWMFGGPAVVQYWRSFEQLVAYSRDSGSEHLPAWRKFNRLIAHTQAVGIWHETYEVSAGQWEAIYADMPAVGLMGAVGSRSLNAESTADTRLQTRA